LARLDPIEKFAKWFYLGLAVLIVFFAISAAAKFGIPGAAESEWKEAAGEFLLAAGVSFVVAIAAAAVGCLLGFLFGIPRSLQRGPQIVSIQSPPQGQPGAQPQSAEPAKSQPPPQGQPGAQPQSAEPAKPQPPPQEQSAVQPPSAEQSKPNEQSKPDEPALASSGVTAAGREAPFLTNTSLEEISDWLTKIIIGLGLVQFQTFIAYLYKAALYAASFVAHTDMSEVTSTLVYDSKLASPFFFALIITSLVSACFFTYLETRTRLTLLFVGAFKATGTDEHKPSADRTRE
jgi:multisubunit Na+/H+ antiporter MnhC subunit